MKKWILALPLLVMLIGSAGACVACGCADEEGCTPSGPYSITTEENNMFEYRVTMMILQDEIASGYEDLYAYIGESGWDIDTVKHMLVGIDGLEQELYYLQLKTTTITTIQKHCSVQEDGTCELDRALLASQKEITTQYSKQYQAYQSAGYGFSSALDTLNDLVLKRESGGDVNGEDLLSTIKAVRASRESHFAAGVSLQEYNILDIILGNIEDGQMVLRELPFCDTPISDFSIYTWYNDWIGVTKRWVWVAYYDMEDPPQNELEEHMIQEVCYCSNGYDEGCSGSFPANDYTLSTYWANRPTGTALMQVKFFYTGRYNARTRNLIWEMNKTSSGVEATYDEYTSTSGSGDDYKFEMILGTWLVCCQVDDIHYIWGNTHCGGCFAEDESESQNFVNDER